MSRLSLFVIALSVASTPALATEYTATWGTSETAATPISGEGSVADYYRYNTTYGSSAYTPDGLETADTAVFFLFEDGDTGEVSLVTLLDKWGSGGGSATVVYEGVEGASWTVKDDPGDSAYTVEGDEAKAVWRWINCCTDGGALTLAAGDFCVSVDVTSYTGISRFALVAEDADGGLTRTAISPEEIGTLMICADSDADDDGIPDDEDDCDSTPAGDIIDETGCSIADYCPCDGGWKNHGEYVSCVAHVSGDFMKAGLISGSEKGAICSDAGRSTCGKTPR